MGRHKNKDRYTGGLSWKPVDFSEADKYDENGGFSMLEEVEDYIIDPDTKQIVSIAAAPSNESGLGVGGDFDSIPSNDGAGVVQHSNGNSTKDKDVQTSSFNEPKPKIQSNSKPKLSASQQKRLEKLLIHTPGGSVSVNSVDTLRKKTAKISPNSSNAYSVLEQSDEQTKEVVVEKKHASKKLTEKELKQQSIEKEQEEQDLNKATSSQGGKCCGVGKEIMRAWNFCKLDDSIMGNLKNLNFLEPTEIQKRTIDSAINDNMDVIGAAETGSGKTFAFVLPILHKLIQENSDDRRLACLIVTPTRELAIQIHDNIKIVTINTGIKSGVIIGGLAPEKQKRVLKSRPHIITATPGRLYDCYESKIPHIRDLTGLRFLVLDEADRMVEKGKFKELCQLLDRLPRFRDIDDENSDNEGSVLEDEVDKWENKSTEVASYQRQTFVFSATLSLEKEKRSFKNMKMSSISYSAIQDIKSRIHFRQDSCVTIDLSTKKGVAEALSEAKITCLTQEKDTYLLYFLQKYPGRTLVFCNSIDCIRHINAIFKLVNVNPMCLHAHLQQRQRLKNLDRFKDQKQAVLLATDVAARGLDIKGVEHVIHYQLPRSSELYIHRSGRTARAKEDGLSVMLLGPEDMKSYTRICNDLNKVTEFEEFPVDRYYFPGIKKRLGLARRIDKIQHSAKKSKNDKEWKKQAAEDLGIILDSDEEMDHDDDVSLQNNRKKNKEQADLLKMQNQLKQLLSKQLFESDKGECNSNNKRSSDVVNIENKSAIKQLTGKTKKRKKYINSKPTSSTK